MGILRRAWNIIRSRYFSDSPKEREESDKDVDKLYEEMSQKLDEGAEKLKKGADSSKRWIKRLLWDDDIKRCFKTLKMEPTDDMDKIHTQWRRLQKKFHPDRFHLGMSPSARKQAAEESANINAAYAMLKQKLSNKKAPDNPSHNTPKRK